MLDITKHFILTHKIGEENFCCFSFIKGLMLQITEWMIVRRGGGDFPRRSGTTKVLKLVKTLQENNAMNVGQKKKAEVFTRYIDFQAEGECVYRASVPRIFTNCQQGHTKRRTARTIGLESRVLDLQKCPHTLGLIWPASLGE